MDKFLTLRQLHDTGKYPLSYERLQMLFRKRSENGLDKCGSKIGRKYFIREDLFDEWILNHNFNAEENVKYPFVEEEQKKFFIDELGEEKGLEQFAKCLQIQKEERKEGVVDVFSALLEEELKNENRK